MGTQKRGALKRFFFFFLLLFNVGDVILAVGNCFFFWVRFLE